MKDARETLREMLKAAGLMPIASSFTERVSSARGVLAVASMQGQSSVGEVVLLTLEFPERSA